MEFSVFLLRFASNKNGGINMSQKQDYYFAPAQAEAFTKLNKESIKKISKNFFKNQPYTESVPTDTNPECGVADATFLGTGTVEDEHTKGVW